jgi:CubicO group peptidase (beta-lactamase class C family)
LIGYGTGPRWQGLPWNEETVQRAREVRTHGLRDPIQGYPVLRGLGIVVAGKEDAHLRGFGHGVSAEAFGHNGAGGQIAWVDPNTDLSFVYLTNGHDRHAIRQAKRGIALSSLAAKLA